MTEEELGAKAEPLFLKAIKRFTDAGYHVPAINLLIHGPDEYQELPGRSEIGTLGYSQKNRNTPPQPDIIVIREALVTDYDDDEILLYLIHEVTHCFVGTKHPDAFWTVMESVGCIIGRPTGFLDYRHEWLGAAYEEIEG